MSTSTTMNELFNLIGSIILMPYLNKHMPKESLDDCHDFIFEGYDQIYSELWECDKDVIE